MKNYDFQYCPKLVIYSRDESKILLCKRKGEQDFDGIYSFIGGKMENTDLTIIDGLRREKNEEVGKSFKVKVFPTFSTDIIYRKKDGNIMILPHYYCIYESGQIELNEEYSDYKWIAINEIENFEPKINTIPDIINKLMVLKMIIKELDSIVI